MKQVITNTTKIFLAAMAAILAAELLSLDNSISAGIVAILTILPTKKETIRTAVSRFLAFVIALVIAAVSFYLFGFGLTGFLIYLALFIFTCQIMGWTSAMAMDSVIISHFLLFGSMAPKHLVNEILIFVIGVGIGIAANLSLRKNEADMKRYRDEADEQIRSILRRMSERLPLEDKHDYNGDCFHQLDRAIFQAEEMARTNYANQFRKDDTFDLRYIDMRRRQRHVLMEMYKLIRRIHSNPLTLQRIADFLRQIADEYDARNDVRKLLASFDTLWQEMKETPLPVTREEFEDRARLFALMQDIEEFLLIKAEFSRETTEHTRNDARGDRSPIDTNSR